MKSRRSSARAAAAPKPAPASSAKKRPAASPAKKPKAFVGPASKRPKAASPVSAPVAKKPKTAKEDVYEVERLLDHKPSLDPKKGKFLYLVHWDGWSDEHNSWEPESNLRGCPEKLKAYCNKILEMTASTGVEKVEEAEVEAKLAELEDAMSAVPESQLKKALQDRGCEDEEFSTTAKNFVERALLMLNGAKSLLSKAEGVLLQEKYKEMKEKQTQALIDFAKEINEKSPEEAEVTVENEVDDEFPPKEFVYTPHCIGGAGVVIPDDPLVGCECTDCSSKNKTVQCCPKLNGAYGEYAHQYNKYKRVVISAGNPIYECNKHCKCPPTCINRVVQHGRKVKVTIFRTEDRGWGLRAAEFIKEGTYVCEYVGEIITNDEAERRGKFYDAEGRTYLFDLDFASPTNAVNVIDAAKVGNVSHFINHSCEPNLGTYCVYINCVDLNLPQIAFFALRDIKKGEELTFDYSPIPHTEVDSDEEEQEEEEGEVAKAASLRDIGSNSSRQLFKPETNGEEETKPEEIKAEETKDEENVEVGAKAEPDEGPEAALPAGVPNGETVAEDENGNDEPMDIDSSQQPPVEDKDDPACDGDVEDNDDVGEGSDNVDKEEKVNGTGAEEAKVEEAENEGAEEKKEEEGEKKPKEKKKTPKKTPKKTNIPPVPCFSGNSGGRCGIKAYGTSRALSDGEEAAGDGGIPANVPAQSAMMCKCGAPTCRKIIFLWGN